MDDAVVPTYSVSFRLQRTTTEFAFVSVALTADLMIEHADGSASIDVDKLVQRAIEMGRADGVAWQPEERHIQPHPIQTPPPGSGDFTQEAEHGAAPHPAA